MWLCFSIWCPPVIIGSDRSLMKKAIINSNRGNRFTQRMIHSIGMGLTIAITVSLVVCRPVRVWAIEGYRLPYLAGRVHVLQGFENHTAMLWGHIAASHPRPEPSIGCEPFLGPCKRPGPEPQRAPLAVLRQDATRVVATLSLQERFRVYLVRRGDSLWDIARHFGMRHRTLAQINGLKAGAMLQVGRPLKVAVVLSRELRLDVTTFALSEHPSLLEQIRMTDGRPVPRWMVTDFAVDVIDKQSPGAEREAPKDDLQVMAVVIRFQLVKSRLEGRARQYASIVLSHAQKYNLDPALVMAMIHTESAFDPNARSPASAYGLMQVVPHTAGEEAYHRIYGERRRLTPEYLYNPDNNIALGTAYLDLLTKAYLGSISDPLSRTYCAVAAYHAGPSNVGRVFVQAPSIQQAARVINSLQPSEVYRRLVEGLPSIESRNYVRNVIKRIRRYSGWYSHHSGGAI